MMNHPRRRLQAAILAIGGAALLVAGCRGAQNHTPPPPEVTAQSIQNNTHMPPQAKAMALAQIKAMNQRRTGAPQAPRS